VRVAADGDAVLSPFATHRLIAGRWCRPVRWPLSLLVRAAAQCCAPCGRSGCSPWCPGPKPVAPPSGRSCCTPCRAEPEPVAPPNGRSVWARTLPPPTSPTASAPTRSAAKSHFLFMMIVFMMIVPAFRCCGAVRLRSRSRRFYAFERAPPFRPPVSDGCRHERGTSPYALHSPGLDGPEKGPSSGASTRQASRTAFRLPPHPPTCCVTEDSGHVVYANLCSAAGPPPSSSVGSVSGLHRRSHAAGPRTTWVEPRVLRELSRSCTARATTRRPAGAYACRHDRRVRPDLARAALAGAAPALGAGGGAGGGAGAPGRRRHVRRRGRRSAPARRGRLPTARAGRRRDRPVPLVARRGRVLPGVPLF
jgi:hypothetical protein